MDTTLTTSTDFLQTNWGATLAISTDTFNITGTDITSNYYDISTYIPYVQTYYQPYYSYWTTSKVDQAFKLIQKLIEKKLIKEPKKVSDFIELVNSISEIL